MGARSRGDQQGGKEGARRKGTGGGAETDRQSRGGSLTVPLLIAIQQAPCGLVNPLDYNCLAYPNSMQMAACK